MKRKATEKATKKIAARTVAQMDAILSNMVPGKWYRSSDLMDILDLKETRTKELLRLMLEEGKIPFTVFLRFSLQQENRLNKHLSSIIH